MFSVIIPTLLKPSSLFALVDKLIQTAIVGEIIIINNSLSPIQFNFPKVIVYTPSENIYVNPAWNLGVSMSKYNLICLCNDDINFDVNIFSLVCKKLERNDVSIIGPDSSCFNYELLNFKFKTKSSYVRNYGYGTLMFLKKSSYVKIPDNLKIWCGDDFLFHSQKNRNYVFSGIKIFTEMSVTSNRKEFDFIKMYDIDNYPFKYFSPYLKKYRFEYKLLRLFGLRCINV